MVLQLLAVVEVSLTDEGVVLRLHPFDEARPPSLNVTELCAVTELVVVRAAVIATVLVLGFLWIVTRGSSGHERKIHSGTENGQQLIASLKPE